MPTIKKESIASGPPHSRPRPRPRRKVSVATKKTNDGESSPHRTYAEVAATPSPPGHVVSPSHDSTPAGSVIDISDSSKESTPTVSKTTTRSHAGRQAMTTRASNGIVKKRVLEDAAVFSDIEASTAVPPSKKPKYNKPRVPVESSTTVALKYTPRRTATRSQQSPVRDVSPLASAFSSSDDTPSRSVVEELKQLQSRIDAIHHGHKSSKSLAKLKSGQKREWYDDEPAAGTFHLVPAAASHDASPDAQPSAPAPEFKAWQKQDAHQYSDLKKKGSRSVPLQNRSASPMDWPSSPHQIKKDRKGKARVKVMAEDPQPMSPADGDATDEDVRELRRGLEKSSKHCSSTTKLGSTSKGTASSGISEPPPINSFMAALAKKGVTLDKALAKGTGSSPRKEQYLADLNGHRVLSLPSTCEVSSSASQDVLLEDDYAHLPNLTAGSFRSWNSTPGDGFIMFSGWATQLPGLNLQHALAALRFTQHRHFVNLSRVSPMKLHTNYTAHDNSKSTLQAEQRLAICLSPILVTESHLLMATDRGLRNKFIKGTLHEQEMQRLVGAACMAFGHGPVLQAQIDRDMMVFSTMGNWRSDSKPEKSSSSAYIRSSRLLSKSPEKGRARGTKAILDVTDTVPIYDARQRAFNYGTDLDNIETILPIFDNEIPSGSFAVVAYTMSSFKKGADWHVNTNVQFVILIKDFL